MAEGSPTVVRSTCRLCAVCCGTLVTVDGDRVVGVAGDPDDPWSRGYTCQLGRSAPAFHTHAQRLNSPLVRQAGVLEPRPWSQTLDDITARLRDLVAAGGPGCVAHYTGTGGPLDPIGYAMAHTFFRSLGTEANYSALSVDCPGKHLVPELVAGVQLPFHPDFERCSLYLAIGVNTVLSHGHGAILAEPLVRLRELRARGAKVAVVDPRRSETAHHADLHIGLRPGSDPALLAFLVRSMLASGDGAGAGAGATEALGAQGVDADSVERLWALVAPFDAACAAGLCGVEAEELVALAALVSDAGRVAIETGTGVSMSRAGTVTEWLAWVLAAVTDSLDRPGGVLFNPGFLRAIEDALPSGRGDLLPGPASRPDLPRIVNGEMPCAALADEIEAGNVRALFVRAGNPMLAFPDSPRLRAALSQLELLVVADVRLTETAALATHVLPLSDFMERGDIVSGYLQPWPFLRWAPPVVAPVAERRPLWWIFAELDRRMGFPLLGSARVDAQLGGDERGDLSDETVAAALARAARHPWDDVRGEHYGVQDRTLEPGWLVPGRLPRPLDLAPAELVDAFEEWRSAATDQVADRLVLVNRRVKTQYNSFAPGLAPPQPMLFVHPTDASRLGLVDGAAVSVSTARGSVVAQVELTDAMRPGTVSLPHAAAAANVNELTTDRAADPRTAMPQFSGFPVEVRALPA